MKTKTLYKLFTNAAAVPLYFYVSLQGVQFFDSSVHVFPSVRPFASEKEFEATVNTVRKFQEGVGKELHQKLLQRAKTKRNWVCNYSSTFVLLGITDVLFTQMFFFANRFPFFPQLEEWWLDTAYLEVRIPSQLNVNFGGPAPYLEHYWPPAEGTQMQRASISTWHTLQYWNLIRT